MIEKIKRKIQANQFKRQLRTEVPAEFEETIISWVAHEFVPHNRGKIWKITSIAIVLLVATIGLILGSWTLSLAILAFTLVYVLVHHDQGKLVEVTLSNAGIKVGNRIYPFYKIQGFWLVHEPPAVEELTLSVKNELHSEIKIQLENMDPRTVREFLIGKVPEINRSLSFTDILARLLKV